MKYPDNFLRHSNSCKHHKPPGRQVYHSRSYKIYEVDGKVDKLYCQNLCLLGKLFLDHKTVNYDIDSFYFYVLVEVEERTKRSSVERVVSSIGTGRPDQPLTSSLPSSWVITPRKSTRWRDTTLPASSCFRNISAGVWGGCSSSLVGVNVSAAAMSEINGASILQVTK